MTPTPALIVEPALADVLLLVPILSVLGFQVTVAESFAEAKQSLRVLPKLLITEIRLGEFNGLHLVFRCLTARPDAAAIVTSAVDDPVLRAEAERLGATFVGKPFTAAEVRASILRTVLRERVSAPSPIRAPFERRQGDRRQGAVDVVVAERRISSDRRRDPGARIRQLSLH